MPDQTAPIGFYGKPWSRRDLLRMPLLAAPVAGGLIRSPHITLANGCEMTPAQTEGPFYMGGLRGIPQAIAPNDLTQVKGANTVADGDVIWVEGQVIDRTCTPVAGARVEIWQACATGRYAHPRDSNPSQLDPNFGYFGFAVADEEGHYRFKTIKPGPYGVGAGWVRPSHIHFRVEAPRLDRLTTQMYFAGDAHQDKDGILNAMSKAERKRVVIEPSRDQDGAENRFRFDISLAGRALA